MDVLKLTFTAFNSIITLKCCITYVIHSTMIPWLRKWNRQKRKMGTALKLVIKETKFRMYVCIKQNGSLENDLSKVPWSIIIVGTLNTFYSPNKIYQVSYHIYFMRYARKYWLHINLDMIIPTTTPMYCKCSQ